MTRKEEILLVTFDLAAKNGLSNVSMSQIAEGVGIKKPSLYNHFKSKEEIITELYQYLRDKAKEAVNGTETDYGAIVKGRTLEEALDHSVHHYMKMSSEGEMLRFYKIIYSERAINPEAAKILANETERMIITVKNLFYVLKAKNLIRTGDIDTAATGFAMTMHAMMDYQLDCAVAGLPVQTDMIRNYIRWFCEEMGGKRE